MKTNTKWVFDFSHSRIGFSVKHFGMTQTEGLYKTFSGSIHAEKDDFSDVHVDLSIETKSFERIDSCSLSRHKNIAFIQVSFASSTRSFSSTY